MFRIHRLRFHATAAQPVYFPPGKAANVIRGALGNAFRRVACSSSCAGAAMCADAAQCGYARIFEPHALGAGPSGMADPPRPFVLRASALDGFRAAPGCQFSFGVNLAWTDPRVVRLFVLAFSEVAREGLGPARGVIRLQRVETATGATVLQDGHVRHAEPEQISLEGEPGVRTARIRFVTPTEIKSEGAAGPPVFGALMARLRDRISILRALYQDGPLEIDFRALGERARQVRTVATRLEHVDVERRSSRTTQVHPLGGFVGEVDFEGDLGEFMGYLRLGEMIGVGRQTVWGKGEFRVDFLDRHRAR